MRRTQVGLLGVAVVIAACVAIVPGRCDAQPPPKPPSTGVGISNSRIAVAKACFDIAVDHLIVPALKWGYDALMEWWYRPAHGTIEVNRHQVGAWEMVEILYGSDDKCIIKFHSGYLCAEGGGGGSVIADRKEIREWEYWSLKMHDDNTVSFVSHEGYYLCAEGGGGGKLVANRPVTGVCGAWEKFKLPRCGKTEAGREVFALQASNGQYVSAQR